MKQTTILPSRYQTLNAPISLVACAFALSIGLSSTGFAQTALDILPNASGALIGDLANVPAQSQPFALVRDTKPASKNQINLVTIDPKTRKPTTRRPLNIQCERISLASQKIAGVPSWAVFCLGAPAAKQFGASPYYRVTDGALKDQSTGNLPLGMIVSRARIASDAAYASSTAFVSSGGYSAGNLSTEALVIDLKTNKILPQLERWVIRQNGKAVNYKDPANKDLNVWGVSFVRGQSNVFYATVQFNKVQYLAKGDVAKQSLEVMKAGIECPSVSPDGKRIAYKHRDKQRWHSAVLDLTTFKTTVFKDPSSVDDQIEWLDNDTLLYETVTFKPQGPSVDLLARSVSASLANPSAAPTLWLSNAASPAVSR